MIIIEHTHADGTTLTGSSKNDGVLEIVRQHHFLWRRYAGIHIPHSRDQHSQDWKINRAAEALRAAGHEVSVQLDNEPRATAEREADRAERVDAREERLTERADAAFGRSDAARTAGRRIAGGYPLGQPVLIDHYSAGRHLRDIGRMHSHDRTERREYGYGQHLAGRASGARSNEDAKAQPRAIMRRIERLEVSLRLWQRRPQSERAAYEIKQLTEDIAHQRAKLAELDASGAFVAWGPDNVRKGDVVAIGSYGWVTVTRVNKKSVSYVEMWNRTSTWDSIFGLRRDGMQYDAPNAEPWPVEAAERVSRWAEIKQDAGRRDNEYTSQTRHVRWAQRIVHGLATDASAPELQAFLVDVDKWTRRDLAQRYLTVFDRLDAGEQVADIIATTETAGLTPLWVLPDTEPVDIRADQVQPGDLIKGTWDNGWGGRTLHRGFCGLVVHVTDVLDARELGESVTVTLADGTDRTFKTHRWLAGWHADPTA